jgi:hypothetical protein
LRSGDRLLLDGLAQFKVPGIEEIELNSQGIRPNSLTIIFIPKNSPQQNTIFLNGILLWENIDQFLCTE